ncbi:MAG: mechanosensitive ion channel family protein [Kofleriaceae bacterium]
MSDLYAYGRHLADVYLLPIGLRILLALLVFLLGRSFARVLLKGFDRLMERSSIDVSLRRFLCDLVYAVMLLAVAIAALDIVGIETTAVIAVLGAAGLAVGLALQGSLSNFAAGVMLIVLRPYKVTDLVVLGKHLGRVEAIRVFHTVLVTGDNREITIPNGLIIAAPIENLTVLGRRRVDLLVQVTEAPADLPRIRQLLEGAVIADPRVQAAPPPAIEVAEISDGAVKLYLRPWTSVEAYGAVATEAMERIKDALAGAGLKFSVSVQSASG